MKKGDQNHLSNQDFGSGYKGNAYWKKCGTAQPSLRIKTEHSGLVPSAWLEAGSKIKRQSTEV